MTEQLQYEEYTDEKAKSFEPDLLFPLFSELRLSYTLKDVRNILEQIDTKEHFTTILGIVRMKSKIVGFTIFFKKKVNNYDIIQFKYASVSKEYQSMGVYKFLINNRNRIHNPDFFVGRPHNPQIFAGLSKLSKKIYPDILGNLTDSEKTFYRKLLIENIITDISNYDKTYSITRNAFKNSKYSRPESRNIKINEYFKKHVGLRDAVVILVDNRKEKPVANNV